MIWRVALIVGWLVSLAGAQCALKMEGNSYLLNNGTTNFPNAQNKTILVAWYWASNGIAPIASEPFVGTRITGGWVFQYSTDRLVYFHTAAGDLKSVAAIPMLTNSVNYGAVRYCPSDTNLHAMMMNGISYAIVTSLSSGTDNNALYVGRQGGAYAQKIQICDVVYYDRCLTDAEILTAQTTEHAVLPPDKPLFRMPFRKGTGELLSTGVLYPNAASFLDTEGSAKTLMQLTGAMTAGPVRIRAARRE